MSAAKHVLMSVTFMKLFQSGAGILCDDLEPLDLPTEIKEKNCKVPSCSSTECQRFGPVWTVSVFSRMGRQGRAHEEIYTRTG